MKSLIMLNILLIACLFGCLGGQQTTTQNPMEDGKSSSEKETESFLAVLELSTPKTTYTTQDSIPLELKIQNGKYDLLVPISSVTAPSAFKQITLTDSNGVVVKMKRPIPISNTLKTLYKDAKSIRCVQGFDMKAELSQKVSLKNLLSHYELQAGNYTVKLDIVLEVYNEFLEDQHPQIIELQKDIMRIQNNRNPQYSPEAKKEAIGYTQDQIDVLREKYKDELQDIYLPLPSFRGKATLESNTVSITIEE